MSGSAGPVSVDGRPTPMVLSVARRLRDSFERGVAFSPTGEPRTVRLASATDAQHAYLTIVGTHVSVAADGPEAADLTAKVRWSDPVPGEWSDAADMLAGELCGLLAGPDLDWRAAAQNFWTRARDLPGMPERLVIHCFDEDATTEFGDGEGERYKILGTSAALTRLLGGSSLVGDELERGELAVDGSSAGLSALFGANLKVVCGER